MLEETSILRKSFNITSQMASLSFDLQSMHVYFSAIRRKSLAETSKEMVDGKEKMVPPNEKARGVDVPLTIFLLFLKDLSHTIQLVDPRDEYIYNL